AVRPRPAQPAAVPEAVVAAEPVVEVQLATPETPAQRWQGTPDIPVVYPVAMAAAMAARGGAATVTGRPLAISPALAQVTALLRTPQGLRSAMLLREVLAAPLCHRRR